VHEEAGDDPGARDRRAPPAVGDSAPRYERHVRARRDGDDRRGKRERDELGDHPADARSEVAV
jgi:hypothetical protein